MRATEIGVVDGAASAVSREVLVSADTLAGALQVKLASDGAGSWTVNDQPRPDLDGMVDIDLKALDRTVRRLDQTYRRLDPHRFHYTSERGFEAVPRYDDSTLIVDYPGIAVRFA